MCQAVLGTGEYIKNKTKSLPPGILHSSQSPIKPSKTVNF